MSNARLMDAEKHLSGIASKVLNAVPISEPWQVSRIGQELKRTGSTPDIKTIQGCLESLKKSGLVKEPKPGEFIRITPKPKTKKELVVMPVNEKPPAPAVAAPEPAGPESSAEPLDRLSALADMVRGFAADLNKLADGIEDAALGVEEKMQAIQAETAKMRQLKELLKGI